MAHSILETGAKNLEGICREKEIIWLLQKLNMYVRLHLHGTRSPLRFEKEEQARERERGGKKKIGKQIENSALSDSVNGLNDFCLGRSFFPEGEPAPSCYWLVKCRRLGMKTVTTLGKKEPWGPTKHSRTHVQAIETDRDGTQVISLFWLFAAQEKFYMPLYIIKIYIVLFAIGFHCKAAAMIKLNSKQVAL